MTQETTNFEPIPVAIILTGDQAQNDGLKDLLGNIGQFTTVENEAVLTPDTYANGQTSSEDYPLLFVETDNQAVANEYLNDGIIAQAISPSVDEQGRLNFTYDVTPAAANSINASIVYAILSYFASNTNAFTLLYDQAASLPDPTQAIADMDFELSNLDFSQNHIVASSRTPGVSPWSNYYYVCLAYICIYFMALGINLIIENEAKYSNYALRETVSPSKKYIRFFASYFLWQIGALLVVDLLLMIFKFNDVPLGQDMGRIISLMTLGTTTGMLLGTALATTFKVSENILTVLTTIITFMSTGISLFFAFTSGLFVPRDFVSPVMQQLAQVASPIWQVKTDEIILSAEILSQSQLNTIYQYMGTQILIALAFIALTYMYRAYQSDNLVTA